MKMSLLLVLWGIDGQKLEMLFISSGERGKGTGKQLINYGIQAYSVRELAVNEQNPLAKGFMNTWASTSINGRITTNRETLTRFYT